jgi:hypothetical protein
MDKDLKQKDTRIESEEVGYGKAAIVFAVNEEGISLAI